MKKYLWVLYLPLILIANQLSAANEGVLNVHSTPLDGFTSTVKTSDGAPLNLGASDKKLRIVNVWALWCATCRKEMPILAEFARESNNDEIEFITIATGRNDPQKVSDFMRASRSDNLPVYYDPKQKFAAEAGIRALPQTIFLNAKGKEIARIIGEADFKDPEFRNTLLALTKNN